MDLFFESEGYVPVASPTHGIPSIGLNQIYMRDEGEFIMVKYGVQGDFPLRELITTPKGFLLHDSVGDKKFFLYFRGLNQHAAKLILNRMQEKLSSFKLPSIIPKAYAEDDCGVPSSTLSQISDFTAMSAAATWKFGKSCFSGMGAGVWDSTVGRSERIWENLKHPIDTIEKVGDSVSSFTLGLAKFMKGMVTDTSGTLSKVGASLGGAWSNMVDVVAPMPWEMKTQFACTLLGAIGVDAALMLLTAGVASPKLALTLTNMAQRFVMTQKIFEALSRMEAGARTAAGFTNEKMKRLMQKLMDGSVDEKDLKHFNDVAHADKDLGLVGLACYI